MESLKERLKSAYEALSDAAVRAAKTGIQTFAAQIAVSGLSLVDGLTDATMLEKAGVAAVASLISYVWNVVLAWSASE